MDINPITGAMKGAADLIKTFHNPAAKRQAQLALAQEANSRHIKLEELDLERYKAEAEAASRAQTEEAEATKAALASRSWFVAGARPSLIWVGSLSLLFSYVVLPLIGIWVPDANQAAEHMRENSGALWPVIGGTGIVAVARSHDKWRGVADK